MSQTSEDFIPGRKLFGSFFHDLVEPILNEEYPRLEYAAGLIGSGSEVLGYDDPMSTDHSWGPRVMLFLDDSVLADLQSPISELLANRLPYTYRGYTLNFSPTIPGTKTRLPQGIDQGPVNHRVQVLGLLAYLQGYLGIDVSQPLTAEDWLIVPGQKLKTVAEGAVYRDDTGRLREIQQTLSYYPDGVWRYLLAAGWARVGQEEHFLGRTGYRGDELGSRLIASRLIHDLMNLCFLIERVYPPYSKWFGTAFQELASADTLLPIFGRIMDAGEWQSREKEMVQAYEYVAQQFNDLGLGQALPAKAVQFHDRPFQVIDAERYVKAVQDKIVDKEASRIARTTLIGGVEQFSTSTDLLSSSRVCQKVKALYS